MAIAGALDFLHANQLLHLDVKPANILFDTSYSPYLSDFGIAISHSLDDSKNCDKKIVYGTMPYLAPEVLSGNAEPRSDQFSFAIAIWEFLIGQRPFKNRIPKEIGLGWKRVPFPPGCRETAGHELNAVFQKALSFDPNHRFESCMAFAMEIVRHWPFDESEWQDLIAKASRKNASSNITRSISQAENDTNPSSGIPLPKTDNVSDARNLNRLAKEPCVCHESCDRTRSSEKAILDRSQRLRRPFLSRLLGFTPRINTAISIGCSLRMRLPLSSRPYGLTPPEKIPLWIKAFPPEAQPQTA